MSLTENLAFHRISALVYALACVAMHDDDDKTKVIDILSEEIMSSIRRLERSLAKHGKPAPAARPTAKLLSLPGGQT